jgi:N-acetylmuramoyl-L-alanine amidase
MPFTIRLSASRIALFAAIAILPVSAEVLAEPGVAPQMVVATADAAVTNEVPAPVLADVSDVETVATTPDIAAADIECVAKVVHHEAGNQPETGKLAVAQVIVNRAESGRFPGKVCDVANQPGQFFKLAAYNPARNTPMWRAAVDAARAALSGQGNDVAKGAMFFHSAAARPDRFFRSRQRVVQLHDQVFYR